MDFILTSIQIDCDWEAKSFNNNSIYYKKTNKICKREIFFDTPDYFIIGDANISFIQAVENKFKFEVIEKHINRLKNGYIIFFNKTNGLIYLYTDIFGYYQLFYIKTESLIIVSSDFNALLNISKRKIDDFALLDILLFNYTLLNRTIYNDIKRIKGGTKLIINQKGFKINIPSNFADNFKIKSEKNQISMIAFSNLLSKAITNELVPSHENVLAITAGFDSRLLLAACKSKNISMSTVTFGQKGNIEQETVSTFIEEYSENHLFIELNIDYKNELSNLLDNFISVNIDNPAILDLPHYLFMLNQLNPSNLILGFMGGELLTGQSIGSQVTFTNAAAVLLKSKNHFEASENLKFITHNWDFIDHNYIKDINKDYVRTISEYFHRNDNTNILKFLINESYVKFFGTVNKVFKNHSNLILPFIDEELINYILDSDISFLYKEPFKNNPFVNFKSKLFYANCISSLHPPLAETKLDRLYRVKDLCKIYRLPNAGYGYLQSHVFKKNKKQYPKPHHYDLWYINLILNQLKTNHLKMKVRFFSDQFTIGPDEYLKLPSIEKKKLANIAAINIALNK